MRDIGTMWERLRAVSGLVDTLTTSRDCFELMQLLVDTHADRDPSMFAAFMFAAESAADGRDTIQSAPSAPDITVTSVDHRDRDLPDDLTKLADRLAGLASELSTALLSAARKASDPGDRRACEYAARQASHIGELLAG